MSYEVVISEAINKQIGNAFSFIGVLLAGAGLVAVGYSIYLLPDDMLPLYARLTISVLVIFLGLISIFFAILKALGIITIVAGA